MKTKNLVQQTMFAALITAFVITGCKKDKEEDFSAEGATMYDNAIAEASFEDAGNVSDEGVNRSTSTTPVEDSIIIQTNCATITIDTITVPHTATIDFGTTDCLGRDGNYRRGKIHVSWTGHYRDAGSTHTITFEDYYLNFNKIEGTKTVTNNGYNAAGHLVFTVDVQGSITIDPQYSYNNTGGTITFTSNRTREWIEGEPTLMWRDDVYLISGTSSGTCTNGTSYTMSTDPGAPLRKEIGFAHFTSGILNITPSGKPARIVDYSYLNNNRDDLARVTVNGQTFTIRLGRRH